MQGTLATALLADRRITASREENATPRAAADVKAAAGGQAAWPGAFRKLNVLPPYGPQRRK